MKHSAFAVVLFAHGSRDPLWRVAIDAVAEEMHRQSPQVAVRCAFLELTAPDLPTVVQALLAEGHGAIRIVPMFLGVGRHGREDLPALVAQLRQRHPELRLELLPAVGEMPELTRCLAHLALQKPHPA
ncbi:MAG: sirohydrochlorin chelatase [Limnohabitans sp.]